MLLICTEFELCVISDKYLPQITVQPYTTNLLKIKELIQNS